MLYNFAYSLADFRLTPFINTMFVYMYEKREAC